MIKRVFLPFAPWLFIGAFALADIDNYLREIAPADVWFQVATITVQDARQGEPIYLTVGRKISKPFTAKWIVTVRRMEESGLVAGCIATGQSHYAMDAVLPSPLSLDWWTYPIKCNIQPGRYRLDTVWTISPPGYPDKTVSVASNIFEVRPN